MDVQTDALQRIAVAVTPAVMVSACALIALGLDNQVSRMSARLRELAREHRELPDAHGRRDLLRRQVDAFDARHRILTRALQLDYGALLSFVVTSFLELAAGLLPIPAVLPLATFAAGVVMLGGMALLVMRSMQRARSALMLERAAIEAGLLLGAKVPSRETRGVQRLPRAADFTLEWVTAALAERGIVSDDARRSALAREAAQRARLLRTVATERSGQALRRAEISPIEVLASFQLKDARGTGEVLDEDHVARVVAEAAGLPYCKIDSLKLDAQLITRTLSRPFARRHGVLPLERRDGVLVIAAANPFDRELFESLRGLTGVDVEPVVTSPSDIHRAIAEVYGFRQQIREAQQQLQPGGPDIKNLEQFVDLSGIETLEASSEPIVAAVEYLLHYAFEQRASDIHVEPRRDESIIRMRIDGVLHPVYRIPKGVHGAIANRLKIMSRLDIAARRPQDGRIRTARGETEMELRISTIPTAFGDKIVVRILDPDVLVRDLSELGFMDDERAVFEGWLERPHGLIAVTGPTGSGKTTTLYSALQALASPEVNIVTIEDPIEMVQEGLNQIAANPKTGTGFADSLRHVLRQDPDVIMVGEIRDAETANQAVQAALTGHMVLTTLHTSDTVGAVARLRDLGVPSFLIGATLTGVVAQRLVRRVCVSCAEDVLLTADQVADLGVPHPEDWAGKLFARRGVGCAKCRQTGHFGRTGIFELLPVNPRFRHLVAEGATPEVLLRTARQDGLRTLREHAVRKIAAGTTPFEEAMRATADAESP